MQTTIKIFINCGPISASGRCVAGALCGVLPPESNYPLAKLITSLCIFIEYQGIAIIS